MCAGVCIYVTVLRKMPLLSGRILCQYAYTTDQNGYLAGWVHTVSLAPSLQTGLNGTTLKLTSNPNLQPNYPNNRSKTAVWKYTNRLEATFHHELKTDGAFPELTPT